jgi:hypothetical protein
MAQNIQTNAEDVNWADFISDSDSDKSDNEVKMHSNAHFEKKSTKSKSNRIAEEIAYQEK